MFKSAINLTVFTAALGAAIVFHEYLVDIARQAGAMIGSLGTSSQPPPPRLDFPSLPEALEKGRAKGAAKLRTLLSDPAVQSALGAGSVDELVGAMSGSGAAKGDVTAGAGAPAEPASVDSDESRATSGPGAGEASPPRRFGKPDVKR